MRHFTADNLYEYMDGNSESYLAYGFTQMQGVTCKSGENTLVVGVWMLQPKEDLIVGRCLREALLEATRT